MTKKKRFGISDALTRGLSETINVVENNTGMFRNVILPLSRVALDPNNPRKLAMTLEDIRLGVKADDPDYGRKQEELERLRELAHTIKASGVINPIVVYKHGEAYRVVAGERRCLASILAGKQEIDARVFTEKPKAFDLKLMQWVENTAREDLTLEERLGNVRDLLQEYRLQQPDTDITATVLKNITGLSLSQTTYYLAALNAPDDIKQHIQQGDIRNLDKAALLSTITSPDIRRLALDACLNGASLKELRTFLQKAKGMKRHKMDRKSTLADKKPSHISLGTTSQVTVIKTMVDAVLSTVRYGHHQALFAGVNWNDSKAATRAFKKLVALLEAEKGSQ